MAELNDNGSDRATDRLFLDRNNCFGLILWMSFMAERGKNKGLKQIEKVEGRGGWGVGGKTREVGVKWWN